jgi:hypothetical protein
VTRTSTAVLLGAVAAATVAIYAGSVFLTTRDQETRLDSDTVTAAAKSACTSLRTDLEAMPVLPPGSAPPVRQERLVAQAARVREFVAAVEAVGGKALDADRPSRAWLADWEALAAAREAYARDEPTAAFQVPLVAGEPLTRRMSEVGLPECVVPEVLSATP